MISRRTFVAGGVALISAAPAKAYPVRQVTLIVPFPPGASADGIARIMAEQLSRKLSATIVVDNKPGSGGSVGLVALSNAQAEGQVLGLGATGALVISPHVDGSTFDPLDRLAPIAKLIDVPLVLVAHPASRLATLKDLVDRSKASPQGLSYGSTGTNSAQHLSIELLREMSGANLTHIPYRGSAPAVTDVLGGQIPLASVDLTSANEHIRAGRLIAIGVTAARRFALAPDIPTFGEQGLANFDVPAFIGMFGPKSLAPDLIGELSAAVESVLAEEEVKGRIERLSCAPSYLDAAAFKRFLIDQSAAAKTLVNMASNTKK